MKLVLLIAAVIVALIFYTKHRQKKVVQKMNDAVQLVKLGLFNHLSQKYLDGSDVKEAGLLAAGVVNFIFDEEPMKEEAIRFQKENGRRIADEARRLSGSGQIRQLITQAFRTQALVRYASAGRYSVDRANKWGERLRELGILVPGGDAPTPDTFIPVAIAFYNETKP